MTPLAQIQQAEQNLFNAQLAGDADALATLIADDLLFVGPTGELASKAMDLETYRSGMMHLTALVPDEPIIKFLPPIAIVSVVVNLKGVFSEQVIDGAYRYLRVWTNHHGTWQITAGSVTRVMD